MNFVENSKSNEVVARELFWFNETRGILFRAVILVNNRVVAIFSLEYASQIES